MKTVIVTGAASGVGCDIALELWAQGWKVIALDINPEGLAVLQARSDGAIRTFICDMSQPDQIIASFAQIKVENDRLDALIYSAGVVRVGALENMGVEDVTSAFSINTIAPWLSVREALPLLRAAANASDPARVVLIGSISGIRPKVGSGAYAATKSALHVLSNVYAAELAHEQILVNTIAPGAVNTPMTKAAKAQLSTKASAGRYRTAGASPLGRVAEPSDITSVVVFLLSKAANFVSGTVIPVDGATRAAYERAVSIGDDVKA